MNNQEWVDFLSKQFDISRNSAKKMLHYMFIVKLEDNIKRQFEKREVNINGYNRDIRRS